METIGSTLQGTITAVKETQNYTYGLSILPWLERLSWKLSDTHDEKDKIISLLSAMKKAAEK